MQFLDKQSICASSFKSSNLKLHNQSNQRSQLVALSDAGQPGLSVCATVSLMTLPKWYYIRHFTRHLQMCAWLINLIIYAQVLIFVYILCGARGFANPRPSSASRLGAAMWPCHPMCSLTMVQFSRNCAVSLCFHISIVRLCIKD